jgi:signal transduction histidine kinase
LSDLDSILPLFASLTRISQIEASDRMAGFGTVNLASIAREVVELFDAAAEEKGTRLSAVADGPLLVTGDRDLLFDAVANLIDNAIKHGRAGRVRVQVAQDNCGAVVSIADDGPGIPRPRKSAGLQALLPAGTQPPHVRERAGPQSGRCGGPPA